MIMLISRVGDLVKNRLGKLSALLRGGCFAAAAVMLTVTGVSADINLVFGAYTADKPTAVLRQFKPILDHLSTDLTSRLGEPVHISIRIAQTYDAGIADLVEGRVDFARFGPASYVVAKQKQPEIGILAMETVLGQKIFRGVIVVNTTSDIQTVEQLRNRSVAFGDQLSTIGRYLAQQRLLEAGISGRELSGFDYLGRHDRVGAAVGQGSFDAGALKFSTYEKLRQKGVPIRILAELTNVTKPWLHKAGADQRVLLAIRAALLELDDPETLKNFTKTGFVPGTDQDYHPIRLAMQLSEAFGG